MSVLLLGHPGEQFRLGRKIRAKRFGKVAIDVGVLFLGCDGEGEDLSFIQVAETHGAKLPSQRIERTTPPSTRNAAPFVAEESGLATNATMDATSSVVAKRCKSEPGLTVRKNSCST